MFEESDHKNILKSILASMTLSMSVIQDQDEKMDPQDMIFKDMAGQFKVFLDQSKADEIYEYGYIRAAKEIDKIKSILF